MPELLPYAPGSPEWLAARLRYCPLCGHVNPVDLGPVTDMCLDGRACRRRQAGLRASVTDEHTNGIGEQQ